MLKHYTLEAMTSNPPNMRPMLKQHTMEAMTSKPPNMRPPSFKKRPKVTKGIQNLSNRTKVVNPVSILQPRRSGIQRSHPGTVASLPAQYESV